MNLFFKRKHKTSEINDINEKLQHIEEDFINLNIHINFIRNELLKEIQEIKSAITSKI